MKTEEAFLKAYDDYSKPLLRHVFFRTSNEKIAEDILQETFYKAWRQIINEDKEIRSFKTYFYTIANNLIIDFYRQKNRDNIDINNISEKDHLSINTKEKIEAKIDSEILIEAMEKLDKEVKEIILFKYISELSIREISTITGKKENNIRVIMHRGLKEMRELLK